MSEDTSFKRERDEEGDSAQVEHNEGNRESKKIRIEGDSTCDGELFENNPSQPHPAVSEERKETEELVVTQPQDENPEDEGAPESLTPLVSPSVTAQPAPLLGVQVNVSDVIQEPVNGEASKEPTPSGEEPSKEPTPSGEEPSKEPTPSGEEPSMDPASSGVNYTESSSSALPVVDINSHKPSDPSIAPTISNPNSIVEERAEISAQYVGKVIGKGGEMLRDLQARSGCRLDVDQNVPHGNPRILTYRGTRKKVDLAKQMVSQKL